MNFFINLRHYIICKYIFIFTNLPCSKDEMMKMTDTVVVAVTAMTVSLHMFCLHQASLFS